LDALYGELGSISAVGRAGAILVSPIATIAWAPAYNELAFRLIGDDATANEIVGRLGEPLKRYDYEGGYAFDCKSAREALEVWKYTEGTPSDSFFARGFLFE